MSNLIEFVYERVTGRPYFTVYRLSEHFREQPPVQVRHAGVIALFTDAELYANGEEILGALAAQDTRQATRAEPLVVEVGR